MHDLKYNWVRPDANRLGSFTFCKREDAPAGDGALGGGEPRLPLAHIEIDIYIISVRSLVVPASAIDKKYIGTVIVVVSDAVMQHLSCGGWCIFIS